MDPLVIIGAVVTALTTVAGLLFKELIRRAVDAEADADFWRDYALHEAGLAEIATEQAERVAPRKRRTR